MAFPVPAVKIADQVQGFGGRGPFPVYPALFRPVEAKIHGALGELGQGLARLQQAAQGVFIAVHPGIEIPFKRNQERIRFQYFQLSLLRHRSVPPS